MASTPAAWPSISGFSCWRAQRRLPSMMIATCRGRSSTGRNAGSSSTGSCAIGGASVGRASGARATLDLEDLLLLGRATSLDLGDMPVGGLLERLRLPMRLVRAHVPVAL